MAPFTCFFIILLSPYVTTSYARIHPVMHPIQNEPTIGPASPEVVEKACGQSTEKELCVSTLKSQAVSDLKEAASAAIRALSGEVWTTSAMIKDARKKEENKEVVEDGIEEETLADCDMSYMSLVEILTKATTALLSGPETDVLGNVKAAGTTAEMCEKSIAGGRKSTMVEEVAKKNENVRKLCSIALSVYNVYAAGL